MDEIEKIKEKNFSGYSFNYINNSNLSGIYMVDTYYDQTKQQ